MTHRAGATFGELCETWLTHASGHLAANTVTETRRILDRTLLPRLGDVPLAGLRPEHLDALYADLLRSGRRDGGAMSPATVQRIHGVVRRASDGRCPVGLARREPGVHRHAAPIDSPGDLTARTDRRCPPDRRRGP